METREREGIASSFPIPGASAVSVWSPPRLRRPSRAAEPGRGQAPVHLEYVFTRAELEPVLLAIRSAVSCGTAPLDSPVRLQEALETMVRGMHGRGEVSVRRSPAALLTPEYWQIAVAGVDARTHEWLRELLVTGRP